MNFFNIMRDKEQILRHRQYVMETSNYITSIMYTRCMSADAGRRPEPPSRWWPSAATNTMPAGIHSEIIVAMSSEYEHEACSHFHNMVRLTPGALCCTHCTICHRVHHGNGRMFINTAGYMIPYFASVWIRYMTTEIRSRRGNVNIKASARGSTWATT